MASAAQAEVTQGQRGTSLRTTVVIIYGTLALLILTVPQSLPNWLRDMYENPVQQALLQAASGVQAASQTAGLDVPYRRARAAFRQWAGKDDD